MAVIEDVYRAFLLEAVRDVMPDAKCVVWVSPDEAIFPFTIYGSHTAALGRLTPISGCIRDAVLEFLLGTSIRTVALADPDASQKFVKLVERWIRRTSGTR